MASSWTHPVCLPCWGIISPDRRPVQLTAKARELELCCRCRTPTRSGIYWRADPETLSCRGDHDQADPIGGTFRALVATRHDLSCRTCIALGRLRLWRIRGRHYGRRHSERLR